MINPEHKDQRSITDLLRTLVYPIPYYQESIGITQSISQIVMRCHSLITTHINESNLFDLLNPFDIWEQIDLINLNAKLFLFINPPFDLSKPLATDHSHVVQSVSYSLFKGIGLNRVKSLSNITVTTGYNYGDGPRYFDTNSNTWKFTAHNKGTRTHQAHFWLRERKGN
jgi:hypothetical protein